VTALIVKIDREVEMRFSFDFVVRMAGSTVVDAADLHEAKKMLAAKVTKAAGHELVDFEIVKTTTGPLAAMTELDDLKKAIKNRK
jgi:hypothetical protein